jgi:WG containing repeat
MYFPVRVSGKYGDMEVGYLDEAGKVRFSVHADEACGHYDGLAAIRRSGKVEIISENGKRASRSSADYASGPQHGKFIGSVASGDDDLRGLLNRNGDWCIKPKFYLINCWDGRYFSAKIKMFDDCSLYQANGLIVLKDYGGVGSSVSEDLVKAGLLKDKKGRQGFRRLDGDWQIKPRFDSATPFVEGVSFVTEGLGRARVAGIIDTNGNWIHRFPKKVKGFCDEFSEGVIGVYQGETSGLMNLGGDLLCEGEWNPMDGKVVGGVIPTLKFKGKKYGLMDTQGNWRVKPEFETVVAQVGPFVAFRRETLGLDQIVVVNTSGRILWDGPAAL